MTSIVSELQADCLSENLALSALLRKAYVIATKLSIEDFKVWIKNELDGYISESNIPQYRQTYCELKAWNPYCGWIPMIIPNDELNILITQVKITQPISEIEKLTQEKTDKGTFTMPLAGPQLDSLQKIFKCDFNIMRFIPSTTTDKICDSVRTLLLEWSMKLEEQGILGEGLSFSREEKNKADNNKYIHISNFQGILGDVNHSEIKQNLSFCINQGDIEELTNILRKNQVEESDINELIDAIKIEPLSGKTKNFGSKVSAWLGKMIGKAASGTWKITTNVATELLMKAINQYYGNHY